MIIGLILLALSLLIIQLGTGRVRVGLFFDITSLVVLLIATVLLVSESAWFWLVALLAIAMTAATLNRYYGVAAQRKSSFPLEAQWLAMMIAAATVIAWSVGFSNLAVSSVIQSITVGLIVVTVPLHALLTIHVRRYRLGPSKQLALDDLDSLPTVSLLIPARNESHALNDTLSRALQSTYPKLEVLVLDDCSHDKTPEIIRGFAHDGARFVEGKPTPTEWLGRNWALQQLTQAANGELLVFADVDVKFSDDTIAEIVGVMQRDELDITSFVPADRTSGWLGQLLPPLTNFWLTLVPFQFLHARAAIGRCFALNAPALPADMFNSTKASIYPVYTLTKQLIKADKRYKFFFGRTIGLIVRKHYHSNAKATIRSASPALANRFDTTTLLLILGGLSIVPLFALATAPWLALVAGGLIWLLFARVAIAVNGWRHGLGSLLWPLQLAHELGLLVISIVQYRFTDLYWKERLVCLPLLEAEVKLPNV